jgi:hypothetical protein
LWEEVKQGICPYQLNNGISENLIEVKEKPIDRLCCNTFIPKSSCALYQYDVLSAQFDTYQINTG